VHDGALPEVLDAINCESVHSSIARVLDITQQSDHVYIVVVVPSLSSALST